MIRELPTHPVYAPVNNLMLYLTEDCNLRCDYCFVPKKARSMSLETAKRAVDFLFERAISGALPQVELSFFGGEPFLRVDLMEETVSYARQQAKRKSKRVAFSATTNATLFSHRIQRLLEHSQMRLLISIDGNQLASAGRPFLSGRPSYELVARNLPRLVACSSWAGARVTFHPQSLNLTANVVHVLGLGAPCVVLAPVVEADWSDCQESLEQAFSELGDWFLAECHAGRVPPLECTWTILRQWHHIQSGGKRPSRTCSIGNTLLAVTVDGQILPCHRFLNHREHSLGTVEDSKLSSDRWKYVHLASRDILGCDNCEAQPVCGGGCRVLALEAGEGLTGRHPNYCLLTRLHAQMAYRLYAALRKTDNQAFREGLRDTQQLGGPIYKLATTAH